MKGTPELDIQDLKEYVHKYRLSLTQRSLQIFYEFEYRCFKYDVYPFNNELLVPLIKNSPEFSYIINKYSICPEKVLEDLETETARRAGKSDPYSTDSLYSCEDVLSIRSSLIKQCIDRVRRNSRKEILPSDIILTILDMHDREIPVYDNAGWNDKRLHTPFNRLSHLVGAYYESLWIKFEDIRRELNIPYDVAISFAGENRELAKEIAENATNYGLKVFYDDYEKANLWGKNLYSHLTEVYSRKAKFCLIIVSKYYKDKMWTNLEFQAAQSKALQENREYILPLRIDNTDIPGLLPTIGYIDIKTTSVEEIVKLIRKKIFLECHNH